MRKLRLCNSLEVAKWQDLELNLGPVHILNHEGLINHNFLRICRCKENKGLANPEIIWTDQPDNFKSLLSEEPIKEKGFTNLLLQSHYFAHICLLSVPERG